MATKEKISLLEVVPCRSEHISTSQEGEEVILSFPRFKYAWMNRYLLPKGMSKEIHVRLEEQGSAVWGLIDGRRTMQEIVDVLAHRFPGEPEYGVRIAKYVLQLHKDGFIKYLNRV